MITMKLTCNSLIRAFCLPTPASRAPTCSTTSTSATMSLRSVFGTCWGWRCSGAGQASWNFVWKDCEPWNCSNRESQGMAIWWRTKRRALKNSSHNEKCASVGLQVCLTSCLTIDQACHISIPRVLVLIDSRDWHEQWRTRSTLHLEWIICTAAEGTLLPSLNPPKAFLHLWHWTRSCSTLEFLISLLLRCFVAILECERLEITRMSSTPLYFHTHNLGVELYLREGFMAARPLHGNVHPVVTKILV